MAKAAHTDYQKLQYFFSDSQWDLQAIKQKRLEIIQNQRTTASTKDGLLAIDDTGCPKPYAKNTEGASGNTVAHSKEKKSVMWESVSPSVSKTKHFPLDIVPYLPANEFPGGKNNPHFKDKLRIAQELFDKSLETLEFSAVTFDSWYATTNLLEHIHTRKKIFFSEIKIKQKYLHVPSDKKNELLC